MELFLAYSEKANGCKIIQVVDITLHARKDKASGIKFYKYPDSMMGGRIVCGDHKQHLDNIYWKNVPQ